MECNNTSSVYRTIDLKKNREEVLVYYNVCSMGYEPFRKEDETFLYGHGTSNFYFTGAKKKRLLRYLN